MLNKAKIIGPAAVILLLGGLAFLVLGSTRKHSSSFQQLSDGLGASSGLRFFHQHSALLRGEICSYWMARPDRRKTLEDLSGLVWAGQPWARQRKCAASWEIRILGTNLGIVTICQMTGRESFIAPHVVVFDESGNIFDGGNPGAWSCIPVPGGLICADCWAFPRRLPRRDKNTWLPVF